MEERNSGKWSGTQERRKGVIIYFRDERKKRGKENNTLKDK
jgi:hypothetical protein